MDELYNFRDCYFETHSVEEAGKKQSDVAQEMEKALKKLEEKERECCSYTTPHRYFTCSVIHIHRISVFLIWHREL